MIPRRTSPHILTTSANLLGFCLIVLTSLHISNKTANTYVDELTAIIAFLLAITSLLSFLSIRSSKETRSRSLELAADILFFVSLAGISLVIALMLFTIF